MNRVPFVHVAQIGERDDALLDELAQHLDGRALWEGGGAVGHGRRAGGRADGL